MVTELLDLSRLESGRPLSVDTEQCDISNLLKESLDSFRKRIATHRFALDLPKSPVMVTVDCKRIGQVMENLLSNAVKYSGDRKYVAVAVRRASLGSRAAVEISVEDHGIGLSPADRQRVFEAFFRADDDRVRARRGSGLGLSLVRHTIDAHGGRIGVESAPEHGTTFRIILPAS